MNYTNLSLDEVILLDKIQKNISVNNVHKQDIKKLKQNKLIEGKFPNYYIASSLAEITNKKEEYIRNRPFNDAYYKDKIIDYLKQYKNANREEFDNLLIPMLSSILDQKQKQKKISNIIQSMRRASQIKNEGTKFQPIWKLFEK